VVYEAEYPQGATDLSAVLASVREADPDMLIASNFTSGTILTIRQMGELGLQPGLTAFILGPTLPGLSDDVGDAAEGLVEPVEWRATNPFVDEYLDWSAQDYADAFEAAYGYFPDHHPPQSSAAVMAYVHALGDAGSLDRVAVRDALSALDVMTFYGPIRFDENGQNVAKDLSIVQIQDGEPVVVYPPDVAEGELRYPGSG
jgi:branched-chain amino acid transport system substrate-binding protein